MAEYPTVTYSPDLTVCKSLQHFWTLQKKKKFLYPKLRTARFYGHKLNYLEEKLTNTRTPLAKTIPYLPYWKIWPPSNVFLSLFMDQRWIPSCGACTNSIQKWLVTTVTGMPLTHQWTNLSWTVYVMHKVQSWVRLFVVVISPEEARIAPSSTVSPGYENQSLCPHCSLLSLCSADKGVAWGNSSLLATESDHLVLMGNDKQWPSTNCSGRLRALLVHPCP